MTTLWAEHGVALLDGTIAPASGPEIAYEHGRHLDATIRQALGIDTRHTPCHRDIAGIPGGSRNALYYHGEWQYHDHDGATR